MLTQIVVCLGTLGVKQHRHFVAHLGIVEATLLCIRHTEVVPCSGVPGMVVQCLLVECDTLVEPVFILHLRAQIGERDGEVAVGDGKVGVGAQGALVVLDRQAQLARVLVDHATVAQRLHVVWIVCDRLLVVLHGQIELATLRTDHT